jgi:NSS family neurotransmitter:Na+ symporter
MTVTEREVATSRPTFTTSAAAAIAMVGVAVGLGNFWRFPYLVGRFGGTAFVLFYLLLVVVVGIPGLMAEWALGRQTRLGAVGAYRAAGVPFGQQIGWFFFAIIMAANAYYSAAVGWVLFHGISELAALFGMGFDASIILPPAQGFDTRSFALQLLFTGFVVGGSLLVLVRGLRAGIEKLSRILVPAMFAVILIVVARSLTLPGASAGLQWYLFKFRPEDLTGAVMVAALGQLIFSLSLGGTFMVVYGSYLDRTTDLRRTAVVTAGTDTLAGLLGGLAIFPAVFALGLEVTSGPRLIFETLPRVFDALPAGSLFGLCFYAGLFFVAFLSAMAALEVVIAGLTDNTRFTRQRAVLLVGCIVMTLAIPPIINLQIFVPWDLTFGSGLQTLGALLAVLTFGYALNRGAALAQIAGKDGGPSLLLYYWIRFVVPGAILLVGIWWFLSEVLHMVRAV